MKVMQASELKARCLAVLDDVASTGEAITITKRGKVVARLVPATAGDGEYPQRTLAGSVRIVGDIVSPVLPENAWEANRPVMTRKVRRRS